MPELLPKSHSILEKGVMEFRPFGREASGERIQDVSGVTVRANLEYLKDLVTRSGGREAGEAVVSELVGLLNSRIHDRAYHVTQDFLNNPWNSYSYEFVMFLNEFCTQLSGDRDFPFHLGREKFLAPAIQFFGRPFSIRQIYTLYPYFVEKFTKGALIPEVVTVTNGRAVMRLRFSERTVRQFGPYLRSCADRICQTTKATIAEVPSRMFGLQAAVIEDIQCIGDGGDYCEWTFTWQAPEGKAVVWFAIGAILGLAVAATLQTWSPDLPLWLKIGCAVIPGVTFWLAGVLWIERQELQQKGKIIQEQLDMAEARHEELREAYLTQEQMLVELRRRVAELTMIHQTGLTIGSTLEGDALIRAGLDAIIAELPYDRAMISLYDSDRNVAHSATVAGVPPEMAEYARSIDVDITQNEGIESTVLKKALPVVIEDVQEALPRLHPLNQALIRTFHTKAFVAVPLKVQNRVLGALVADRLEPGKFTTQDVNLLTTVASQIAIALDNANAYEEIEQLNTGLESKVKERTAALEQLNEELGKANERLKELDRLKSTFLSHCSHELRTPLTSIRGFTDNLLHGTVDGLLSEGEQLYLKRIKANADRLTRMIEDLLDLSRIESKTVRMVWGRVLLPQLVRDVIDQLRFMASEKEQRVELVCEESDLAITGDNDRIQQIVTNLVQNALKFTPEKGAITVEVSRESVDQVGIAVSDTGPGIQPASLTRLFEPFYQGHGRREASSKGLGLGLAIVKSLVDLHGGTITAYSEVGNGTTFRVTLPTQQHTHLLSL